MSHIDIGEFFRQLVFARFSLSPYETCIHWNDRQLWSKVADTLHGKNPLCRPTPDKLIEIVLEYKNLYESNTRLFTQDTSLKNLMYLLLSSNPLKDKGCINVEVPRTKRDKDISPFDEDSQIKRDKGKIPYYKDLIPLKNYSSGDSRGSCEVWYDPGDDGIKALLAKVAARQEANALKEVADQSIIPATSSHEGLESMRAEFGHKGPLSMQYGEDLDQLQINGVDRAFFLSSYGPTSSEYMSLVRQNSEDRRASLRALFDQLKQICSPEIKSPCHSSTSSKKKKEKLAHV